MPRLQVTSIAPHAAAIVDKKWLPQISRVTCGPVAYRLKTPNHWQRTKATLIYKRTDNLRAVQLLLGHTKIDSTVRYFGIEVDDALEIAESVEV